MSFTCIISPEMSKRNKVKLYIPVQTYHIFIIIIIIIIGIVLLILAAMEFAYT